MFVFAIVIYELALYGTVFLIFVRIKFLWSSLGLLSMTFMKFYMHDV